MTTHEQREKIMLAVGLAGQLTIREAVEALGGEFSRIKEERARHILAKLAKAGRLERCGRGQYRVSAAVLRARAAVKNAPLRVKLTIKKAGGGVSVKTSTFSGEPLDA